jgi:hypothetical protein
MHSSQMYTAGPAISFFTSSWALPQKEQVNWPPWLFLLLTLAPLGCFSFYV